jgi:cysteine synthase
MEPAAALSAIGGTPLLRLARLSPAGGAEIWAKWEAGNPSGSMKDRMARSMVEGAERRGELRPGMRVVEFTGGSTGSSLSLVCAAKGYRAHLVTSDAFSDEKIRTMRAFGATVDVLPSDGGRITPDLAARMRARVQELASEPDTFWTRQFENPDNVAGYRPLAEELLEQTGGRVDAWVMGVGTGGCFSGVAETLKRTNASVVCVAVEPAGSRNLSGGPLVGHHIEGIGIGFLPEIVRLDLADAIEAVSDEDARSGARELARREGIFAGVTSGANLRAAQRVAGRLGTGKRVVTVFADTGLKYLAGDLFA